MNDVVRNISNAGGSSSPTAADTDPICIAIRNFRVGFANYDANAPNDDDAAMAYANKTFKPQRRALVEWISPAKTRQGAIEALRMARDADSNDDHAMVGPMILAALEYFEMHH